MKDPLVSKPNTRTHPPPSTHTHQPTLVKPQAADGRAVQRELLQVEPGHGGPHHDAAVRATRDNQFPIRGDVDRCDAAVVDLKAVLWW